VAYPESGFRGGDVVLHDGAPVGQRVSGGRTYSVFNVLELFEPSTLGTWVAEVVADDAGEVDALCSALDAAGARAQTRRTGRRTLRTLCRQCSQGTPHEDHDHELKTSADGSYRLGIAVRDQALAEQVLKAWDAGRGRLLSLDCVLQAPVQH
jgi:hypothetical protein